MKISHRKLLAAAAGFVFVMALLVALPAHAQERRDSWRNGSRASERANSVATTQPSSGFAERYGVIVEGNMFLRDRRVASRDTSSTQPSAPPPSPEQILMLTGIVFEEGGFRAYFENLREGTVVRVAPGDAIAKGLVAEILIDAVAYYTDDEPRWIEIGHDLTGKAAAAVTAPSSAGASTPANGPTTTFSPDVDPSTLSPADRLRLRRQQELQGR
jgi:hypothetical protein